MLYQILPCKLWCWNVILLRSNFWVITKLLNMYMSSYQTSIKGLVYMYVIARISLKYLLIFTLVSGDISGNCFSPFWMLVGVLVVDISPISSGDCRFFGDIGGWSLGESKLPSSLEKNILRINVSKLSHFLVLEACRICFSICDVNSDFNARRVI